MRIGVLDEGKMKLDYILGFESGGLLGEEAADSGLQAWPGQEHPPCSCAHPSEAHPVRC